MGCCTGQALIKGGGRDLLFSSDLEGNTCLLVAAREGRVEVVKVPASDGTRLSPASLLPPSPQFISAQSRLFSSSGVSVQRMCVGQVLVAAGGRELLLSTNINGATCLHSACKNAHLEVVEVLLRSLSPSLSLSLALSLRRALSLLLSLSLEVVDVPPPPCLTLHSMPTLYPS